MLSPRIVLLSYCKMFVVAIPCAKLPADPDIAGPWEEPDAQDSVHGQRALVDAPLRRRRLLDAGY